MHFLAPKIGTASVIIETPALGEMKTIGIGCRMRPEGPIIEAEGRERGWGSNFLGRVSKPTPQQLVGLGSAA